MPLIEHPAMALLPSLAGPAAILGAREVRPRGFKAAPVLEPEAGHQCADRPLHLSFVTRFSTLGFSTGATRYRTLARRPMTVPLLDDDTHSAAESAANISSRELVEAIASAPPLYRDTVIAVDILGMSYGEAARSLRTRVDTIASRLHGGRQHVACELIARGALKA